jgi:hypothetical protein
MKDSKKPPPLLPVILLEQFFGMEGVVAYSLLGRGGAWVDLHVWRQAWGNLQIGRQLPNWF